MRSGVFKMLARNRCDRGSSYTQQSAGETSFGLTGKLAAKSRESEGGFGIAPGSVRDGKSEAESAICRFDFELIVVQARLNPLHWEIFRIS